jgi:hypothetical protein
VAESVNQQVADAVLESHVRALRVGSRARQEALRLLALLEGELVRAIRAIDPSAPALLIARQRLVDQLAGTELRPLLRLRYATIAATTETMAGTLAVFERQNTAQLLATSANLRIDQASLLAADIRATTAAQLLPAVATSQELSATASTWWLRQSARLEERLVDQITVGIVQGEDLQGLLRRVRGTRARGYTDGVMALSRRDATRLIRTQFNSVSNAAQLAVYDSQAQSIPVLQHLSTLDGRTSFICIGRSGLHYTVPDHFPIGHTIPFLGGPSYHWS